jgi:LAO/AO transport system kinase
VTTLLEELLKGDPRALARVITRVENRSSDVLPTLRSLFPHTGRARVLGVTGSPGAGKSSLVDRLATKYRALGKTLAIVAVDPSSPFSGGAILGDRIRMSGLATDPGVFIRSMATRGRLGGLSATTADVVGVLDAAARDPVIVETVGVGQDEIDIVRLADVSIVVLVPGMGDDVQALKAGIMEIGDIFVINKCDRPGVEKMERMLTTMLSLAHRPDEWTPPIVKTIATEGEGIDELIGAIDRCHEHFQKSGTATEKKRTAAKEHLMGLLEERLVRKVMDSAFSGGRLNDVIEKIVKHEKDPFTVVEELVANL